MSRLGRLVLAANSAHEKELGDDGKTIRGKGAVEEAAKLRLANAIPREKSTIKALHAALAESAASGENKSYSATAVRGPVPAELPTGDATSTLAQPEVANTRPACACSEVIRLTSLLADKERRIEEMEAAEVKKDEKIKRLEEELKEAKGESKKAWNRAGLAVNIVKNERTVPVATAVQRTRVFAHISKEEKEVRFQCDRCPANFIDWSARKKHIEAIHEPEEWKCASLGGPKDCGKQMPTRHRLVEHWHKTRKMEREVLQWSEKEIEERGHGGDPKALPMHPNSVANLAVAYCKKRALSKI